MRLGMYWEGGMGMDADGIEWTKNMARVSGAGKSDAAGVDAQGFGWALKRFACGANAHSSHKTEAR